MDMQPRKVTAEQMLMLANFAEMAVRYIEKDHYLQMQKMVRHDMNFTPWKHTLAC